MSELKRAVSTQVKIKVIRAIESGIRMQTVADTMGLSLEKVKEIRTRSNADIKAVTTFLQTATTTQKKMMAQVVRSSGGNELSSRRESLGVSRQTLRRWILAAEIGLLGEYYPGAPDQSHTTMRRKCDKGATRKELEAKIKELEDSNLLLRAECDYLKKKRRDRAADGAGICRKAWAAEVIAVRELVPTYGLRVMLAVSGMSKSTYFYRLSHLEMTDAELRLRREVIIIFEENFGYYGHRKIAVELGKRGIKVDKKTVAKIMKEEGLKCRYRPKRFRYYKEDADAVVPNTLNREFSSDEPMRIIMVP